MKVYLHAFTRALYNTDYIITVAFNGTVFFLFSFFFPCEVCFECTLNAFQSTPFTFEIRTPVRRRLTLDACSEYLNEPDPIARWFETNAFFLFLFFGQPDFGFLIRNPNGFKTLRERTFTDYRWFFFFVYSAFRRTSKRFFFVDCRALAPTSVIAAAVDGPGPRKVQGGLKKLVHG